VYFVFLVQNWWIEDIGELLEEIGCFNADD
jgi:hypothetical protein